LLQIAGFSAIRAQIIAFLPGDIEISSTSQLAILFQPFDTKISYLGFASGPGSQIRMTQVFLE
jgi:hypothetical protein